MGTMITLQNIDGSGVDSDTTEDRRGIVIKGLLRCPDGSPRGRAEGSGS